MRAFLWSGGSIGRIQKIVLNLYSVSIAINAIWRLVGKIPEAKISLPVYSRKLLVAADFKHFILFQLLGFGLLSRLLTIKLSIYKLDI